MRLYLFSFLLALGISFPGYSFVSFTSGPQDSTETQIYGELIGQGRYRFYFDDSYYLNEKSCGFVSIIREAGFDMSNMEFDGAFTDYNLARQVILTGTYEKGAKTGLFQAYHSNGKLKWEANFVDGEPVGLWKYYYPDGNPMLVLDYTDRGMEIRDFWNQNKKHRVKNGRGRYSMRIETDGYNQFGADFIQRRGKVVDGKPNGYWRLEFIYPDAKKEYLGVDLYQQGRRDVEYGKDMDLYVPGSERHSLVPLPWFTRAEALVPKKCNIDEHSGFSFFLQEYLNSAFGSLSGFSQRSLDNPSESLSDSVTLALQLVFEISIDQQGNATGIVPAVEDPFLEKYAERFLNSLRRVVFWYPSFLDGEYIDDVLTLSFWLRRDETIKKTVIYDLDFQRKKGH